MTKSEEEQTIRSSRERCNIFLSGCWTFIFFFEIVCLCVSFLFSGAMWGCFVSLYQGLGFDIFVIVILVISCVFSAIFIIMFVSLSCCFITTMTMIHTKHLDPIFSYFTEKLILCDKKYLNKDERV